MIYVELFYVLIFPMVLNATPELGRDWRIDRFLAKQGQETYDNRVSCKHKRRSCNRAAFKWWCRVSLHTSISLVLTRHRGLVLEIVNSVGWGGSKDLFPPCFFCIVFALFDVLEKKVVFLPRYDSCICSFFKLCQQYILLTQFSECVLLTWTTAKRPTLKECPLRVGWPTRETWRKRRKRGGGAEGEGQRILYCCV